MNAWHWILGTVLALLAIPIGIASGSPQGPTSMGVLEGEFTDDEFGISVASGDVNGDGYADVIVGAQLSDACGEHCGRAYIYYGGSNADTDPDLILTGESPGDFFGYSVAFAGDVNGDGFGDVVVGALLNSVSGFQAGRGYVFFGGTVPDNVPDLFLNGAAPFDKFGFSVGSAGDVNADGFADLIVGAPRNDAGGNDVGRAYVFLGGSPPNNVPDAVLTGSNAGGNFGISVAPAGDVNGDGFADLIVGAYIAVTASGQTGQAYVYFGGTTMSTTPVITLSGEATSDYFGETVATAGDVNGDGFADVIVGARFNDAGGIDAGRAYVFFGGPALDALADMVITGSAAYDSFGASVATAGDLNHDGFDDVIVGAPAYGSFSASGIGYATVYYGGSIPNTSHDQMLTGPVLNEGFGLRVSSAADVNGDSFPDLMIGAPAGDVRAPGPGRVYVFATAPSAVSIPDEVARESLTLRLLSPQGALPIRMSVLGADSRSIDATVYDIQGRIVYRWRGSLGSSPTVLWDGNSSRSRVSSGIYFFRVQCRLRTDTIKFRITR